MRSVLFYAVVLGMAFALVWQFAAKQRVETDLLALLPDTEKNSVAEQAVDQLSRVISERAVFLVGHQDTASAKQSAEALSTALTASGVFKSVQAKVPAPDLRMFVNLYSRFKAGLLVPDDAKELKAGTEFPADRLAARVTSPFSAGLLSVSEDPFGFLGNWLARLPYRNLRLENSEGWLLVNHQEFSWVLVSAELPGSPFASVVQDATIPAIEEAVTAVRDKDTGTRILRAGTVFHSAAARMRAEKEINIIGGISLAGIIVLLVSAYRSLKVLSLGLVSVGVGIGTGLLTTVLVSGRVHLMTLIFGASLLGEAIDYSIQYFSVRLGAGRNWNPAEGLRSVRPRLVVALLTSVLGYSALMLTPFPVLSQIGVFAISGLIAALGTVFILFPRWLPDAQQSDPRMLLELSGTIISGYKKKLRRPHVFLLASGIAVFSIIGVFRLTSDDDVKLLVTLSPELVQEEQQVRELTGTSGSSQFILMEGSSEQELLEREERLIRSFQDRGIGTYGVSSFVPSCRHQSENRSIYRKAQPSLAAAMQSMGFRAEAVSSMENAAAQNGCLSIENWLSSPLSRPFRHLWIGKTAHGYASVVLPSQSRSVSEGARIIGTIPGATLVDKPGSISKLLGRFRILAAWAAAGAALLVYLVLAVRYGITYGAIVLLPTIFSLGSVTALLGYFAIPVTLFHVLALLLVLGVGVNYSIFLVEGGDRGDAAALGVLLSVITTLLSFGLLAFSSMPAAHNFGVTLASGIFISVLLSPVALVLRDEKS